MNALSDMSIYQRFAVIVVVCFGCSSNEPSVESPVPAPVSEIAPGAEKVQAKSPAPAVTSSTASPRDRIVFEDVAGAAGLTTPRYPAAHGQFRLVETMGGGVGLIDFDGNGRLDIYLTQGAEIPADPADESHSAQLYRNLGDGKFENVAQKAGVAFRGYGQGVAIGDYDGDGHPDIYVAGFDTAALYRNKGDGTFEDQTQAAGLTGHGWATSTAFADLDADGDLDLYVVRYLADTVDAAGRPTVTCNALPGQIGYCPPLAHAPSADSLYRNDGTGKFTDIGPEIGLERTAGNGLGLAIADFDEDGKLDIFVANDKTPCQLYRNLGGMKFEESGLPWGLAFNESGEPTAAMGVAVGDADGDGKPDILVTNFYEEGVTLYRNLGGGRFEVATPRARLKVPTRGRLGFGTGFADFDNDGALDLFIANGHVNDVTPLRMPYRMKPQLFRNDGQGRFSDVSASSGPYFATERLGRGAAFGDLDDDGRVDVVVTHNDEAPALLMNRKPEGDASHALRLTLNAAKIHGKAVSSVGSVVKVEIDGNRTITRFLPAGTSYLSTHDSRLTIGVGAATKVRQVTVLWPSGKSETWPGPPLDRPIVLGEGKSPEIQAR
ncbi:CRTAC1 family protein [bacterium]|nr:CRTAC1 family protein [bacterium]